MISVKHLLLVIVSVCLVVGGLVLWQRGRMSRRRLFAYGSGLAIAFVLLMRQIVETVTPRWNDPPIWDVRSFWVWGRIAATTHGIYDPAQSISIGATFPRDSTWLQQFLNVGFIYPPPTILLFAPLGLFATPQQASPWWYAFNLTCLVASVTVLWHAFFKRNGIVGLLVVAVLVAGFYPTTSTLFFGQPLPVLLLVLSLYLIVPSSIWRGILLGAAFIVKPLAIVFLLLPIVRRSWRELGAAIATIAAGFASAIVVVGWSNILPYFTNGPSRRYPLYIWMDNGNESLFSAVLRITHQPVPVSLSQATLFLACAFVVSIVTCALCVRNSNADQRVLFSFLIAYALLVFPPSAGYYNDLLLIPILTLWNRYGNSRPYAVGIYILALYVLHEWWSPLLALAPLSLWLLFAGILVASPYEREARQRLAYESPNPV